MNKHSTRGHTIIVVNLEKPVPASERDDASSLASEQVYTSTLYFADLAGRENEKTTQLKGTAHEMSLFCFEASVRIRNLRV